MGAILRVAPPEMALQRQKVHDMEADLKRFRTDVSKCVKHIQDPHELKKQIVELNKKYVQSEQVFLDFFQRKMRKIAS